MKIFLGLVAILLLYLIVGGYPTKPLKGTIKAVTVTETFLVINSTNTSTQPIQEKTLRIEDSQSIATIQTALSWQWRPFYLNSMEGFPKYRMTVEYMDGTSETFSFTRTEWGQGGETSRPLVQELAKHGL